MPSVKTTLLSIILLLASSITAEASKIEFHRYNPATRGPPKNLPRNTRISRSPPSRIARRSVLRVETRQDAGESGLDIQDMYTAPIIVGNKEYIVVLDSGNPDLWLDTAPTENYSDTKVTAETESKINRLGHGTLEVGGTIGISPLKFGDFEVQKQAFINIQDDAGELFSRFQFNGVFGLGLEFGDKSAIEQALSAAKFGEDASVGNSVVENIFAAAPELPKIVAVDLGRKEDVRDIEGIEIGIGEYPEAWSEIKETPPISLYPRNAERWTVLVDLGVPDSTFKSKVPGVPRGQVVGHLSVGQPTTYLPQTLVDDVYSAYYSDSAPYQTASGETRWLVPCYVPELIGTVTIDKRQFPVHQLDLAEIWEDDKPEALKDYTVCVNNFRAFDETEEQYDITLGSSFMRNVQTVFGFPEVDNDKVVTPPYILLQADTEDAKAETEVKVVRAQQLKELPKEITPKEAIALLNGASSSTPSATRTHALPSSTTASATDEGEGLDGASSKTGSDLSAIGETLTTDSGSLSKFMPAIIGLLAANTIIGLALIVLAVLNYIRRGGRGSTKTPAGSHVYTIVKPSEDH